MIKTDFLIVGAGIIGLTIGIEIQRRFSGARVTIIESNCSACGLRRRT